MQADAVGQLLDQMHAAILVADFATLARLVPDLERALAGLGQAEQTALQQIARKATRNATCLQAAGRGVRAALRRVKEVQQAAAGLVTYDGAGHRATLGGEGHLARRF